jgi:hypothetical protein
MAKKSLPTVSKAKTILEEGEARGSPLTAKQKGFFGMIAGGGTPKRAMRGGGAKSGGKKGGTPPRGHMKGAAHDEMHRPIGDTGDYKVRRRGL